MAHFNVSLISSELRLQLAMHLEKEQHYSTFSRGTGRMMKIANLFEIDNFLSRRLKGHKTASVILSMLPRIRGVLATSAIAFASNAIFRPLIIRVVYTSIDNDSRGCCGDSFP